MREEETVCALELRLASGEVVSLPLLRRDDPVEVLDKYFQTSKIPRTDVTDVQCRAEHATAITTRACEAIAAMLNKQF